MNKHNVISIESYVRNKKRIHLEQIALDMLDKTGIKISEMQTYVMNFKVYLENMARDGHIKEAFANDLKQQIELIFMTASAIIARKNHK